MTQEDKQLLLIDLCNRLPWGVNGKVETIDANGKKIEDEGVCNSVFIDEFNTKYICIEGAEYELDDFKPYLRPMSDMTEDEEMELEETLQYTQYTLESYGWLNKKHFDYRGLIPKGLAIKASKEMYNF